MPEMTFTIQWPDGVKQDCYSPSTVIASHLAQGELHSVDAFLDRTRTALLLASERVRARYGYECSSALDQLRKLEERASHLTPEARSGPVLVLAVTLRNASADASTARSPAKKYAVCVIGGGQAGLSMSYLLKEAGVDHIVLEKNDIAHSWDKERWDSFCLVTPNYQCRLPGYEYSGSDPQGFMVKDEIVQFLRGYAASFSPPLVTGVSVKTVVPEGAEFVITTQVGTICAEQVVVATGGYHDPKVPAFAAELPTSITQIHSRDYKSPEQLPAGEVLVVGSGQSGCQIVEDLMLAGRKVHFAVGDAPRCARRYRGRDVVEWLELMGHYQIPIDQMPDPAAARAKTNHYVTGRDGGHDLDLRQFALDGLRLYGTLCGYAAGPGQAAGKLQFLPNLTSCLDAADDTYRRINKNIDDFIERQGITAPPGSVYEPVWSPTADPTEVDLATAGITSIVWSIGFAPNFRFVQAPIFDCRGSPEQSRGVTATPGLYFLGLPWLHTWGSGRFCGVADDARYLLQRILARADTRATQLSA